MSATRDPDRLVRAWLDLMPDEAPDRGIASVLQATAQTPQVRRPRWTAPWSTQMPRFYVRSFARTVLVVIVLALLATIAFALLVGGPRTDAVVAVVRPDGLYFEGPDGTGPRQILPGSFGDLAWSADGSLLAAVDSLGVVTVTEAGAGLGRLQSARGASTSVRSLAAWSPSGDTLLSIRDFSSPRGFASASVTANRPTGEFLWEAPLPVVGEREWRVPLTIAWRRDGAWAAIDLRRERNLCHETVLVPVARADHSVTMFQDFEAALDCAPHRPAWSNDGRRLAMLQTGPDCWPWVPDNDVCASSLVVYDLDPADPSASHGEPRVIASNVFSYTQPLWLPGDAELLVTRLPATPVGGSAVVDLVLVRADGGGERRIGSILTGDPYVAWGLPGRSIVYKVGVPDWSSSPTFYVGDFAVYDLATGAQRILAEDVYAAALQPRS